MGRKIKTVVADGSALSRELMRMYVLGSKGASLAGSFGTATEAISLCDRTKVDLVIMDAAIPVGIDCLSAVKIIKSRHASVKVILVSTTADPTRAEQAKEAGADGFWYKEGSREPLDAVIRRVMLGERCFPDAVSDVALGQTARSGLTARENDVLRELAEGGTNEEIAQKLGISAKTVGYVVQNLLGKTGFKSRTELVVNAKMLGVVAFDNGRR